MISPLLTDLYQLTMAYGYFRQGRAQSEAVFHLFFRKNPFEGGYAVAAGLEAVLDFVENFRFSREDVAFLGTLRGSDAEPLFAADFLDYLAQLKLSVDIDAIPEGSLVFAGEPLLRVRGNLLEAQLLETTMLTLVNFQTLVATKAARVCEAAQGEPVLEFGMRRAQGMDGAMSATRASFIGGCEATSNVLAGQRYGIPVRGTHAHSWVMVFDSELEAFEAYADAMPNNCVFLVDTYDTLSGVRHAIDVGRKLRARGKRMQGIRIDSGDLAWLSLEARKLLDAAGFEDAFIVGSNDLDEYLVESLKYQGAKISVWGIGTKMVTAYDQPALGGVYKLSMIGEAGGPLLPRVKVSEQPSKTTTPGVQQVRRFSRDGKFVSDVIFDETEGMAQPVTMVDPLNPVRRRVLGSDLSHEDLLLPVVRAGKVVYQNPSLFEMQARAKDQLSRLDRTVRRFVNPHEYPVGLSRELEQQRRSLVEASHNRVRNEQEKEGADGL